MSPRRKSLPRSTGDELGVDPSKQLSPGKKHSGLGSKKSRDEGAPPLLATVPGRDIFEPRDLIWYLREKAIILAEVLDPDEGDGEIVRLEAGESAEWTGTGWRKYSRR